MSIYSGIMGTGSGGCSGEGSRGRTKGGSKMEKSELTAKAKAWVVATNDVASKRNAIVAAEELFANAEREAGVIANELLAAFEDDGVIRTHRVFLPKDRDIKATLVKIRVNSSSPSVESDPVDLVGEG